MGLLDFDRVFKQMGFPVRRPLGESHAATDSLMAATQRELAILSADMMGAQTYLGQFGPGSGAQTRGRGDRRLFRNLIEDAAQPFLILDPRPGLHIVDMNDAYAAVSLTDRRRVAGDKLFDVFPDNPDLPDADGVSNLYESLKRCAQSGREHRMALQRYDIQDPTGQFLKRHWLPVNTPIFDEKGRLVFLVNHVGGAVEA
ncbi:MAG: diguanylate cyclase [Novosphingobium sp.]|nr:diguanylate cyclase [Novosphingobium sp.]